MRINCQGLAMSVFIIILFLGGPVIAGEKPVIGVRMILKEPNYLVEFTDEQEEVIEKKAAEILAARLSERSGFLDFQPHADSADASKWILTAELNRIDPSARGDLNEVGFHLYLSGPGFDHTKKAYWTFRSIEQFNHVVFEVEVFLEEIDRTLQKTDYDGLIQNTLSQIPIADSAELYRNFMGVGWKLSDHSHEDLCMRDESELIVESELTANGDVIIRKVYTIVEKGAGDNWRNLNIKTRVSETQNEQRLRQALEQFAQEKIEVKAVYVRKYFLLHQCKRQVSPLESGL